MGHKRIANKQIKQMLESIFPQENPTTKNNALVEEKKSNNAQPDKLRLDDAPK